ncbi:MAG: asparagine synthase (glutamine-hydrolyzing) [Planctomycetaceae bacterium]|nr:asparagine synthase (glutamine-hydrolyzing) [Planctomycetaceae bacterium]
MCGLAGISTGPDAPPPSREELVRMARSIAHRGPDGSGVFCAGRIGLAHARLAVLDREGGAQPMSSASRDLTIAYNGEVFNHVELRRELEADGRGFTTHSDTEVILAAYERWGADAWERLEGQFALALVDRNRRLLHLVRDRAGICPLLLARLPDSVVFASEAKAIFASGRVDARTDPAGINAVFRNWSSPGSRTVYEGVESLEPGRSVAFALDAIGSRGWRMAHLEALQGRNGIAECRTYARLRMRRSGNTDVSSNDAVSRERRVADSLRTAVRLRLRADIPVGAYLSGGLDSSLLVALMSDELRRSGADRPVTFSIRFRDERGGCAAGAGDACGFDEGTWQRRVVEALGTDHREVVVGREELVGALDAAIAHAETPLLRAGPLPMLLLARFVRAQGIRVVLTGEGADELFGGYDIFKESRYRAFLARDPSSAMRRALASRLHRQQPRRVGGGSAMWSAFLAGHVRDLEPSSADGAGPFASHALRWQAGSWMLRFLAPEIREALDRRSFEEGIASSLPPAWGQLDELDRAQELEIGAFMVPYLLSSQGDRMLMASGVEGRYPYLDGALAAEAASLRTEERLVGLREKPLLRRIARGLLPAEIASRPKWPYRSPIQRAFFGASAPSRVRDALSDRSLARNPLVDARAARALAARAFDASASHPLSEREEMAAFGLLTLTLWHERFIERRTSAPIAARQAPFLQNPGRSACIRPEAAVACTEIDR